MARALRGTNPIVTKSILVEEKAVVSKAFTRKEWSLNDVYLIFNCY